MKTIKRIFILITAIICLSGLNGCSSLFNFEDVNILSYNIDSFTPSGLKGVNGVISIEVENPASSFSVQDVKGTLYYKGKPYISFIAAPVTVEGKTTKTYPVHCTAALLDNVSMYELLTLAKHIETGEVTADIRAVAKVKYGFKKTFDYRKIKIVDLL